jgi:hypothetical protein
MTIVLLSLTSLNVMGKYRKGGVVGRAYTIKRNSREMII